MHRIRETTALQGASIGTGDNNNYVFVPKDFNFGQFGTQAERCMILASNLYQRTLHRRQEFSDWVGLPQAYLRPLLGRFYSVVVSMCQEVGLIEHAERWGYAPGHHCKHFRLGQGFWHRNWDVIGLERTRARKTRAKVSEDYLTQLPAAYRWAAESALRVRIEDIPREQIEAAARAKPSKKISFQEQVEIYSQQIAAVRHQMIVPIKDVYGRLHTPITNLARSFRPKLRIDGESLAGVDIKTSQPLFLGMLVLRHRKKEGGKERQTPNAEPHPYVDRYLPQTAPRTVVGTERWLELIERGDLYEFLKDKAGFTDMTREAFKAKHIFRMLYGPNLRNDPVLKAMQSEFPEIVDFMFKRKGVPKLRRAYRELRSNGLSAREAWSQFKMMHKDDYARLACEMQAMEAEFIFERVIPPLMEAGIPTVTIHDSVLTSESNASMVQEVITNAFEEIGVQAQLHPVRYG